jgi:murein DD-endopeptidase MepM/ murein hydrolase activator NlpD
MVVARLAAVFWHVFHGSLESGLLRHPLARGLARHRWQLLNVWTFWLLAGLTLELCVVPAQFTPREHSLIRLVDWGGIALLMFLGFLPGRRVYVATNLAFTAGSIFMATQMARIFWPGPRTEAVVIAAPFRGEWLVLNGGPSALINIHYRLSSERDALDIERIVNGQERTGDRQKLASFPSWGETILAPADGTIAKLENDREDNPVGQTDEEHPVGNHVVIELGNGRFVLMAHLQKGSVLVAKDEVVRVGQPIARCGNSGNTSGPHLHIQAQDKPDFSAPGLKTMPIAFRDATVLRSGHLRANPPFLVRRNDRIISEPVAGKLAVPRQIADSTNNETKH